MANKTILVTGGAGYIGSHVVRQLGDAGESVVTLDNLSTGFEAAVTSGDLIVGDTGDQQLLAKIFAEHEIDTVMHFARIAVGPQQGRKVFTLQTLPDEYDADEASAAGKVAGLLRASCPPPFGPACSCSKSLPAILSPCTPEWRPKPTSVTR